jgi:acyl-coenzyme A synthetase/AMP-(fatty) acid ligase
MALIAHCRALLGLRAPRKAIIVPALPRNATGKVLRRELAAMTTATISVP